MLDLTQASYMVGPGRSEPDACGHRVRHIVTLRNMRSGG